MMRVLNNFIYIHSSQINHFHIYLSYMLYFLMPCCICFPLNSSKWVWRWCSWWHARRWIYTRKLGVPVMLSRNLDISDGLCNGTRLIITRMGRYVLEGRVISGSNISDKVYVPRLSLQPSDTRIPFKFQRRQFPITVCFAMTINKSQGQSLKQVGAYLPQPVFCHGQL